MGRYSNLILNTSGLVGYWRMNEASSPLVDSVAGRNATVTNAASFGQAPRIASDPAGASYAPNAANTTAIVTSHASLHPGDTFSLEFWYRLLGTGMAWDVFAAGANDYEVNMNTAGVWRLAKQSVGNSCITNQAYTDTANMHHVVMTKSGATNIIYIDGASVPATTTNQTILAGSGNIYLGSLAGGGNPFNGYLSEMAIYNVALTAAQVKEHYMTGRGLWPKRALMGVGV